MSTDEQPEIKLQRNIQVTINNKNYFAELGYTSAPDMFTEDHGLFMFKADWSSDRDGTGSCQAISVILDDPARFVIKDNPELVEKKKGKRLLGIHPFNFVKDYVKFWNNYGGFNDAHGAVYVLREEEWSGFIRGIMSTDMKRSLIIRDYWEE